jgi:hypothetical protein
MNVPPARSGHTNPGAPAQPAKAVPQKVSDDPIELVDEEGAETATKKTIRSFGVAEIKHRESDWKRKTHQNQTGAMRMRSFHGRLSEQGLEYMDNSINEWLDAHPEIEVKFVTSTVGLFEGKIKEPALILNIWY